MYTSAIQAAINAINNKDMFEKMTPEERDRYNVEFEKTQAHKRALEIAEAGRARNFWGK